MNQHHMFNFMTTFMTLSSVACTVQPPAVNPGLFTVPKSIGACHSCKIFIESFTKGLERTARGKYEGGDTAWEEEKLKKSYKRSEMRLVDIQEGICKEETKYSVQCHLMAEKAEEYIEEWWSQNADESTDLYSHICIDKLEVCCPKHHYGKDCLPCAGNHENLCNGNGKCRGDGTRKGNGTCLCDEGYMGEECDQCAIDYHISYKDDNKMLCSKCHMSCAGGCKGGTQRDCASCKPGFIFSVEDGCADINECDEANRCKDNEYCLNSLGSYTCMKCDKSCKECYGDGPDMCRRCAKGYSKKGEFCVSDKGEDTNETLTSTRFMTYIGLLIATGILLPKSATLGSMVGFAVLSYIMGAEYYCMINGHTGLVNLTNYDLFQMFRI
ncbi:cysteine-rich with EGF-like domain protein 2 [Danaus plexippus]|uniref:cysteine-rich with EGF-like domain protein 2 n=1 Tax=Danaus plexippus TaxID=13037 RepID=UPI002AB104A2|nr:cysteine-rich with EGF-like domain protein 2 [Danaus plexippus]XP_061383022.1 cysteine-rich with EGF-like domain protein 2 [Danaus plexippus]XP_061383023.1 cysteine-rich with EGF-like domain protein 2 [Danaus plexippus]